MTHAVKRLTIDNWLLETIWTTRLNTIPGTLSPFIYALACVVHAEVRRLINRPAAILHFSGHGLLEAPRETIWLQAGDKSGLASLSDRLKQLKGRPALLVLDGCYSDAA